MKGTEDDPAWPEAMTPPLSREKAAEIESVAETISIKPTNAEEDVDFDKKMSESHRKYMYSKPYLGWYWYASTLG